MKSRPLELGDFDTLQAAMNANTFHPNQQAGSYADARVCSMVYEDEQGPIGFLQYSKVLRLRTTWCNNADSERNGPSIIVAIEDTVRLAKNHGFTEIIFQTENVPLAKFCERLGFVESRGEYILEVKESHV